MFPAIKPATRALILLNVLLFLLEQVALRPMLQHFALWPLATPEALFRPWQLLTYAFLHAGLLPLLSTCSPSMSSAPCSRAIGAPGAFSPITSSASSPPAAHSSPWSTPPGPASRRSAPR